MTYRTRYTQRILAIRERPLLSGGPCTKPFLGYPSCQILPPRATLRRRREVGRPRPNNTTVMSRTEMVETCSNGLPTHKPFETVCLHTDSSGFGWGAVLNECLEARGFWSAEDDTLLGKSGRPSVMPSRISCSSWPAETSVCMKTTIYNVSHYFMPNLTLTAHDGRTTTYLVLTQHKHTINLRARYIRSTANV
jgi:hypothetical protein